jgi:hypothetical protein
LLVLLRRFVRCVSATAVLTCVLSGLALAQGRLEARYSISMIGIPIGKAIFSLDVGSSQYTTSASGRASGMLSVLFNGEGSMTAEGSVKAGRPVPTAFTSAITRDSEKSEIRMLLAGGAAKEFAAETGAPAPDRVPLTPAHRLGVIDPISAMLVPINGAYDVLAADVCQRTLPVFDGRRRYDLKLTFKRMDSVKAESGYAGPVVVCGVAFQPIAGHRASSTLVNYLSEGRDIELWLAPVSGTRVLASVGSMLGNLVVQATRFETVSQTAAASRIRQ